MCVNEEAFNVPLGVSPDAPSLLYMVTSNRRVLVICVLFSPRQTVRFCVVICVRGTPTVSITVIERICVRDLLSCRGYQIYFDFNFVTTKQCSQFLRFSSTLLYFVKHIQHNLLSDLR